MGFSQSKIFAFLDYPARDGELYGSIMGIEGWVFSNQVHKPIIDVLVDGKLLPAHITWKKRMDVARDYPSFSNAAESGFYIEINLEGFENGSHVLELIARSQLDTKNMAKRNFVLDKDQMLPPRELMTHVGDGNFESIGQEFLKHFKDLCDLKPHEKVLDVGCGIGRMAIPLTEYLQDGFYDGFDIVSRAVEWCNKNITKTHPNFHFTFSDVYNQYYNPHGKYQSTQYKFPYDDEHFDFVFLTSVFTHMRPKEVENYLSEISRVLKRGGRCLITFFLLNPESEKLMVLPQASINFKYQFDGFSSRDSDMPEFGIAYPEKYIFDLYKKNVLQIKNPVYYGSWCTRKNYLRFQDIIIAAKN